MKVDAQTQSLQPQVSSAAGAAVPAATREGVASQQVTAPRTELSTEDVRAMMEGAAALITDFLAASGRKVAASVDDVSGAIIVRVVNPDSGEVIRQIPSEEALAVLRYFNTTAKGVLVSQSA